jgi:hypothetical protein
MNLHNFKDQDTKGKAILILTYPFAIGVHWIEWRRMRKLQCMIRKWIGAACKNPKGHEAEMVKEWSDELRWIYGK